MSSVTDSTQMKPRRRPAVGRLRLFIDGNPPDPDLLPAIHITRAYSFDEMIEGDYLTPARCHVFKEDLVYFFYGRPAYRAKDGVNARLEFEWPIVFLVDPKKVEPIRRLFPFDTGAFAAGLYKGFFDSRSELDDFSLTPTLETAQRLVAAFYNNSQEYLTGDSKKNVDIPRRHFEAQGIHELARQPGFASSTTGIRRDERSSAIEIQISHELCLLDSLLGVIMPTPYMDDPDIRQALERWKPRKLETYPTLHNQGSEAWAGQIYVLVERMLRDLSVMR